MNRKYTRIIIVFCLSFYVTFCENRIKYKEDGVCTKDTCTESKTEPDISEQNRYILYDVNPPEGFNLRRDVYIRMAVFAHKLKNSLNKNLKRFTIVLPPWLNLYHWDFSEDGIYYDWATFFDVNSLKKYAPVTEIDKFFDEIGQNYKKIKIDEVYILQHFEDMFETGNFDDRYEIAKCNKDVTVNFYDYQNITSDNIKCLSFHGPMSQLEKILEKTSARTVMFYHAEIPLHDSYGSKQYWEARRSMRFSKKLYKIANHFRKNKLNSTDELDNTVRPDDWTQEKPKRDAKGGPYLSVHLRRKDFVRGRPKEVPSIKNAAKQIKAILKKIALKTVYIATDAPYEELKQLKDLLSKSDIKTFHFDNSELKLSSGELAIVDQIICSHARFFVGTHESTFSFRIQEEREILGFPVETTFNRLCGDDNSKCEKVSVWKIVY